MNWKKLIVLGSTFLYLLSCGDVYNQDQKEKMNSRSIEAQWDTELFLKDIEKSPMTSNGPFTALAFPVKPYEFAVFHKPFNFNLKGQNFSGITFGENKKGTFNYRFSVIFHSGDSLLEINSLVSSRNAPYLTAQGEVRIKNIPFQFFGVKSLEDIGFLTVNMKTFDLRFGETIVIFPFKENSFVYLQLTLKPSSINGMDNFFDDKLADYINQLKQSAKIEYMLELNQKEINSY